MKALCIASRGDTGNHGQLQENCRETQLELPRKTPLQSLSKARWTPFANYTQGISVLQYAQRLKNY